MLLLILLYPLPYICYILYNIIRCTINCVLYPLYCTLYLLYYILYHIHNILYPSPISSPPPTHPYSLHYKKTPFLYTYLY
ncbi:hypothetical protein B484DRAFT_459467 [Ochromonadaceae sp. CCMP2298]|nr:hypothetical protein B484DRAFT_459467 [Ochromonadaceae sp. CCMP2298]